MEAPDTEGSGGITIDPNALVNNLAEQYGAENQGLHVQLATCRAQVTSLQAEVARLRGELAEVRAAGQSAE